MVNGAEASVDPAEVPGAGLKTCATFVTPTDHTGSGHPSAEGWLVAHGSWLTALVGKGARLYGYVTRGYVIDTGTMENYRRAERDVLGGRFVPKRAVSTR